MKIFEGCGFKPHGNVLPLSEFRLMLDWESPVIDEKKKARVIESAESYLDMELKVITLWQYRQYYESGVLSHFGTHFQERGRAMFTLGMAEALERKGRFTDKLTDVIWAILEESTWMLPQHAGHTPYGGKSLVPPVVGDKYLHGIELASAYRTASMAVVYHYCADILDEVSPIIRERMLYDMRRRTIQPFLTTNFSWSGIYDGRCNNWCPWNVSNVLLATALVEDNLSVRERVVEKSMKLVDIFINNYEEDGGCTEGPGYWPAAGGALFDVLETLYDMTGGVLDLFDNELVRRMGEYEAKMNIAEKSFVNFADGSATLIPPANLLSRYGKRCGSRVLETFGDFMASYDDLTWHYGHPYRSIRSLYTPSHESEAKMPVADVTTWFPNLKVALFRDSENPKEGMFLGIKGGHNRESHNHNDVGSFVVYKEGKPVLIDVGVGTYTRDTFGPNRYTIWTMQSRYHNLAMFDDVGEMQGQNYASRDEVFCEEEKSIELELAGAYHKSVGVKTYKRYARLHDGVITIRDRIELEEEKLIEFIFMTHKAPEENDGYLTLAEGVTLEYDNSLVCEVEAFDPVGMDAMAKWGTEKLYRIHLKLRADKCDYTFTIRK